MMKKILLGLILVFTFQSCSEKFGIESVANANWILTEWPGEKMPNTFKTATLNFDAQSRVSGKSFCNGFGGTVVISEETIKFSELMGTMMFCDDVGQAEKIYLDGLRAINSYKVKGGKLQLFVAGKLKMEFSKAE